MSQVYAGVQRKLFRQREIESAREEYDQQVKVFQQRVDALGRSELEHYYWYHTIDLRDGLITPGDYDLRGSWPAFQFPEEMQGLKVLDVGSATGYFAFEFAKRGADVVSVELPSFEEWDIVHSEREQLLQGLMASHQASSPEEAYYRHLDGPFQFCQERLGLNVRRCYSNIYELTAEKLGEEEFDLIFAGDILLHLFSPLKALDVLASLCRGTLVVSSDMLHRGGGTPLMRFLGQQSQKTDSRTWWKFNSSCIEAMLQRLAIRECPSCRHALRDRSTGLARLSA